MRRKMLASVLLLITCALAQAQDAGVSEATPFSISSLNSPFAVQGDFKGEYRIFPDRIELRITTADIRIGEHCPYKGRRLLTVMKFGLATNNGGTRWKVARVGQGFPLEYVMGPGDMRSLGEIYFSIPIDDSVDVSKHWVVVQVEEIALDVPEEKLQKGYAFAHSCRDIFTLYPGKRETAAR